jgi:excisionase family DNA binding protein
VDPGQVFGGWVQVIQAADALGVTRQRVLQLIDEGKLVAIRFAPRLFLVNENSIEDYKRTRRPRGRPKKQGPAASGEAGS